MHDDHVLLGSRENSVVDAVSVLDLKPLSLRSESLLLHPGDIKDISVGKDFVEGLANGNGDTSFPGSSDNVGWHSQGSGSDEVQTNRVEAKQGHKAMNCASILEITEKGDSLSIDRS